MGNAARTEDNSFALDIDPQIWGEAYREGIARYGDDGTNCVLCGKRTGGKKNTTWVLASHNGRALPPAELEGLPGFDEGRDTLGCSPIGSECKKKISAAYHVQVDF